MRRRQVVRDHRLTRRGLRTAYSFEPGDTSARGTIAGKSVIVMWCVMQRAAKGQPWRTVCRPPRGPASTEHFGDTRQRIPQMFQDFGQRCDPDCIGQRDGTPSKSLSRMAAHAEITCGWHVKSVLTEASHGSRPRKGISPTADVQARALHPQAGGHEESLAGERAGPPPRQPKANRPSMPAFRRIGRA